MLSFRYDRENRAVWTCTFLTLLCAYASPTVQGPDASAPGQGLFGNLDAEPTFKEEDYQGAAAERARYTEAADFTFNFSGGEGYLTQGTGGQSLQVELNNKPSLLRADAMSQTVFTLKPCGLNVPHLHPRSSKVLYVLEGRLSLGFVEEGSVAASRVISQNLTAGQSFVFPEGLAMWVHNLDCQEAKYLDTWSGADPGILNIVPALMKMPIPTIAAAFNIDTTAAQALVNRQRSPIEMGPAECLARCNTTLESPPPDLQSPLQGLLVTNPGPIAILG